jgi:chromosome segregation ATPase
MEDDPTAKCLDVAEKVIGCLNDGEILRRYLTIKKRIYESRPAQLSPHLKRIALEKRELTNQLEGLRKSFANAATLESWILAQLEFMQKKVLPDSAFQRDSVDSACASLLQVVEAKAESNNVIRQRLTDENTTLRDRISSLKAATNEELQLSRKRLLDLDHKFRGKRQRIQATLTQCQSDIEKQVADHTEVEEESKQITASMDAKQIVAKELMTKLSDLEKKKALEDLRLRDLKRQCDRLRSENEAKEREIESQRAAQRFGVADADDRELVDLRTLEAEVAKLIQDNERLSLEVKKKRLVAGSLEVTEISSISSV